MHTGFPQIGQQELQEVAFSLTAVAEDQDVCVGLVVGTAVKIHQHIAAELVAPDIESLRIGLTGIIERIQICHAAGGKHPFKLIAEQVPSGGHDALKPLLLAEHQPVYIQLGTDKLSQHLCLEQF